MKNKKIFYIGLSRSGTTSLHHILLELGFKSQHFCEFLLSDKPEWEKCEEFDALGDTPVPLLYKKLDQLYPDSRFILTIREKEKWLDSMKWMLRHGKVIWSWDEKTHKYHESFYGTRSFNKKVLSEHWNNYHNDVFAYFSGREDSLLTIKLDEGFNVDKICDFLDVPVKTINNANSKKNPRRKALLRSRIKYNLKYYIKRILKTNVQLNT